MSGSDFRTSIPPRFVSFARRYPCIALYFALIAPERTSHEPGVLFLRIPLTGIPSGRRSDLPGSWGTPVHVPCSPTPAEPQRQVLQRFGLAFRNWNNVGLCYNISFGAVSHGPYTRCPRFTNAVTRIHAGLASGWLPALARRDCLPAGFLSEVSTIP